MLRVSLWNTYGFEKIIFNKETVVYEANYKWFKDGKTVIDIHPLTLSVLPIGYEQENKGVLKIGVSDLGIECVTKLPIIEIEKLIKEIKDQPWAHI